MAGPVGSYRSGSCALGHSCLNGPPTTRDLGRNLGRRLCAEAMLCASGSCRGCERERASLGQGVIRTHLSSFLARARNQVSWPGTFLTSCLSQKRIFPAVLPQPDELRCSLWLPGALYLHSPQISSRKKGSFGQKKRSS